MGTAGRNFDLQTTMRRRHSTEKCLVCRGTLPVMLLVKCILYIIRASDTKAEGQYMTPPFDTGVKGFRGGDNGRLQYSESQQRDSARDSTNLDGTVGPNHDPEPDDEHRQMAYSIPIQKYHPVELESEHNDAQIVSANTFHDKSNKGGSPAAVIVDDEDDEAKFETKEMPRILTVLTTYSERTPYVKTYKQAVLDRSDGYEPMVFVVSDEEDDDPEHVVDYKVGSKPRHRALAAIAEASLRYKGQFDWLALGDDDTVFMYNRLRSFLSYIDHTQPVAIGSVDGLSSTTFPTSSMKCFTPEQKRNTSDALASKGCCDDFTHPCKVPVFPDQPEDGNFYNYRTYGPGGLFWPYGGTGVVVSVALVETVVGGATEWGRCAHLFSRSSTDIQLGQCLKLHGYTVGSYNDGFTTTRTADPVLIRENLASSCQVMGVHVSLRRLAGGKKFSTKSFGDAVAAVRDEDESWGGGGSERLKMCPKASEAILKWI